MNEKHQTCYTCKHGRTPRYKPPCNNCGVKPTPYDKWESKIIVVSKEESIYSKEVRTVEP